MEDKHFLKHHLSESYYAHPGTILESHDSYLSRGDVNSPLIVNCPHSGDAIPSLFNEERLNVDALELISRGDIYTNTMTENANETPAHHIICRISPGALNTGRATTSLDPLDIRGNTDLLTCIIDKYTENGIGQGLVPFKTLYSGTPIFKLGKEPTQEEIQSLIDRYYTPYHEKLLSAVKHSKEKNGFALVFDVHSCPSIGTHADTDPGQARTDIIISDANGRSADPQITKRAIKLAEEFGLSASYNTPYTGGYVTQLFGQHGAVGAQLGTQALQIEMSRAAMGIDEQTLEVVDESKFEAMQEFMTYLMEALHQDALDRSGPTPY